VLLSNRRIEAHGEISSDFGRHLSQNRGPRIRLSAALHFGKVPHPWALPTLNREANNIIISGVFFVLEKYDIWLLFQPLGCEVGHWVE
jgi:hypothetical protein